MENIKVGDRVIGEGPTVGKDTIGDVVRVFEAPTWHRRGEELHDYYIEIVPWAEMDGIGRREIVGVAKYEVRSKPGTWLAPVAWLEPYK